MSQTSKTRSNRWRHRFRIGRSKTGLGLFALTPIKKGDFVLFYTGRMIPNAKADQLNTKYLFEINTRWTIDGATKRNVARYINHSCKPNAETDVKRHKIIITAAKTIHEGDEITYNYGRNYFNTFIKPHGCRCQACAAKKRELRRVAAAARARKAKRAAATAKAGTRKSDVRKTSKARPRARV